MTLSIFLSVKLPFMSTRVCFLGCCSMNGLSKGRCFIANIYSSGSKMISCIRRENSVTPTNQTAIEVRFKCISIQREISRQPMRSAAAIAFEYQGLTVYQSCWKSNKWVGQNEKSTEMSCQMKCESD
jgi:hypothetical protein